MMEGENEVEDTSFDLMHPELLSRGKLVFLLDQRQIKLDAVQRQDKELLVDLFHRMVTPKPQRVPRKNRRGRMTEKRIKEWNALRVTKKQDDPKAPCSTSQKKSDQRKGLLISTDIDMSSSSSSGRLKPPPITIKKNTLVRLSQKTSIRTDNDNNTASNPSSSIRKLSSSPAVSSTKVKLLKSPGTLSKSKTVSPKTQTTVLNSAKKSTVSSSKTAAESSNSSKKVSLKRPGSVENGEKSRESSDAESPKKKIKKITWP